YLGTYQYQVLAGRDISSADVNKRVLAVILTKESADRLFQGPNPVGQDIRINGVIFEVIGVVVPPHGSRGNVATTKNAGYFIPVSTLLYLENNISIPSIRIRVTKGRIDS